jgi:hypothetical protein
MKIDGICYKMEGAKIMKLKGLILPKENIGDAYGKLYGYFETVLLMWGQSKRYVSTQISYAGGYKL